MSVCKLCTQNPKSNMAVYKASSPAFMLDAVTARYMMEHVCAEHSECPICYEKIENEMVTWTTPCQHKYHTWCLEEWKERGHSTCPMCRTCIFNYVIVEQDMDSWLRGFNFY
jgi:hypothetical protein